MKEYVYIVLALQGVELLPHHCTIEHTDGKVSLIPSPGAYCTINGFAVTEPTPLTQGMYLHVCVCVCVCVCLFSFLFTV